jgi:hypothetical protein
VPALRAMLPELPVPGDCTVVVAPVGRPETEAVSAGIDVPVRVMATPTEVAASLGNAGTDELARVKINCGPETVLVEEPPQPASRSGRIAPQTNNLIRVGMGFGGKTTIRGGHWAYWWATGRWVQRATRFGNQ